ncbi:branched-chain amino acid ABC transporter permease [Sulfurospirillum sp. T05]|uniref:Branched-chain amino acid ABC transporter permease n=1 Tax=Sulfurospirillum tamanense TaxID=2813362 RepID=A0ABS2WPG4_9BACT|nr:branched-chain amino acid ABC transporter permease [Sulfurospirillum tamanensis]MBN2963493.1 branched-chain amino acid ABC transporter permease [Sulfurospirillum tamanensis]
MKNITLTTKIAIGFMLVMGLYPLFADSAWLAIGTTFLVYACVAFSQDIILGRAGAFNMGHALFFGLGAYATAILNVHFGWPILATWIPAVLLPVAVSVLFIGPIIHLRGDYLLVATIGLNIIFLQLLENDIFGLTGGPNGIFGIDVIEVFGVALFSQTYMYYLAFILLAITLFIMRSLDGSKFGRAMFYINKDEVAAQSMGISIRFHKLYAFALGAGIAGAAGSMFAVQYSAVSPEAFSVIQSIMFFTIVLVGGSASLPGVLIGTFVMFVLPEIFREFEEARYLVFGIAMILTMILRPRGIWPVKFGNIPEFLKKGVK